MVAVIEHGTPALCLAFVSHPPVPELTSTRYWLFSKSAHGIGKCSRATVYYLQQQPLGD